ncbi:hypothetical protein E2C01_093204 [Portunus trituberculatus]|uniref:Uncharacterized protein n=1 Tax=Portunus trituberculatus TaxID=210409 RepID=A0A5B7JU80_PORTR|nr:hypothetical protein [Portunus trituberculatus]
MYLEEKQRHDDVDVASSPSTSTTTTESGILPPSPPPSPPLLTPPPPGKANPPACPYPEPFPHTLSPWPAHCHHCRYRESTLLSPLPLPARLTFPPCT